MRKQTAVKGLAHAAWQRMRLAGRRDAQSRAIDAGREVRPGSMVPARVRWERGDGTGSVVVIAQGDGRFAPIDVEVGIDSNGQTEIRNVLQAGQKVVVSGQFLVDSEANLKASTTRMGEMTAPAAGQGAANPTHRGQ